jgi:hypothetical protein
VSASANKLAAEQHAKLDSYMLVIADEARGHHKHAGSGRHLFGSKSALCIYADGHYHDHSGSGPTAHGRNAFDLVCHLHPNVDPVDWARAFLVAHPGAGHFVPGADTNTEGSAEEDTERLAYITALYAGAALLTEGSPGRRFFTEPRGLLLPSEALALLRWIPNFRGDEGAVLAPYTDDKGELLALGFTYITQEGQKSPYSPARMIYRGPADWNSRALIRLGKSGSVAVETESFEKGLAAFLVDYQRVFITGGVARLGKVPLPADVQKVIVGRDDDPPGSAADQALWRAAMRRRAQNLQVGVTARPKEKIKKGEPVPENFKDLDDVYRHDPELLRVLLDNADLDPKKHGRLGDAVDNAILDEVSWFDEVEFGRAGKDAAAILGIGSVERLSARIAKLVKARIKATSGEDGPDGLPGKPVTFAPLVLHPDPVNCAELLSEMAAAFPKYMGLSAAECDMAALGAVHAHCFDFFDVVVIFVVSSPKPRSGKTRLMRLMARIVPKKLFISGSGAAAAFIIRVIEMYGPNVFLDEFDNIMKGNPEVAEAFRGLLNSAFDREGAVTGKCVPTEQGHIPRVFSLWAPYWIGGLKKPPETVEDRAITFKLRRNLPGDKVKPLRLRDAKEFEVFRSKAARWTKDHEEALRAANPPCPDKLVEFSDRAADACAPIFAIAQLADAQSPGSDWLGRAHRAALTMMGIQTEGSAAEKGVADEEIAAAEGVADKDDEIALLIDIHTILIAIDMYAPEPEQLRDRQIAITALEEARRLADVGQAPAKPPKVTPVISSAQLATALGRTHLFPDRKWPEWDRGKPIQSHHLVKILRDFEITQRTVRLPGEAKTFYGFPRVDLDDAIARYVYPAGGTPSCGYNLATHSHIVENVEETALHTHPRKSPKTAPETNENTRNSAGARGVSAAETDNLHTESRVHPTQPNSPSDSPKPPQSNIVDLPTGAVPRRKKEAEP